MIVIQNVSKDAKPTGPHEYELRINNEVIATFTHHREDGLAQCLQIASAAALRASDKRLTDAIIRLNGMNLPFTGGR